jgi:hypothetical protein
LIPTWQPKVSPVRARLRELLSILLASEILQMRDGTTSSNACPSEGLAFMPVEDGALEIDHLLVAPLF